MWAKIKSLKLLISDKRGIRVKNISRRSCFRLTDCLGIATNFENKAIGVIKINASASGSSNGAVVDRDFMRF